MSPIVTCAWLHQKLQLPNLVLLDASLPQTAEGKASQINAGTIPGSRFFDLKDKFSDKEAAFPNTLPGPEPFEKECQALGINSDSTLVVFDNMGIYSSPRVWWMFKTMGHEQVFVLDGGLPEWINQGYEVETPGANHSSTGNFKAVLGSELVMTYEDIVAKVDSNQCLVVDARSVGRFLGDAPEPRKHLQSGHIPGSVNIPYQEVLNDGKFKSAATLEKLFESKTGQKEQLVFSCGSGLTACIILLASHLAGKESMLLYDGSWTEWAEFQGLKTGDD